jgi:hypothetical protein
MFSDSLHLFGFISIDGRLCRFRGGSISIGAAAESWNILKTIKHLREILEQKGTYHAPLFLPVLTYSYRQMTPDRPNKLPPDRLRIPWGCILFSYVVSLFPLDPLLRMRCLHDFPSLSTFAVTDSKFLSPRFLTKLAYSDEFYAVLNIIFFEQSLFENSDLKNKLHIFVALTV